LAADAGSLLLSAMRKYGTSRGFADPIKFMQIAQAYLHIAL